MPPTQSQISCASAQSDQSLGVPLDHWAHCGIFENGVLRMYMLEGVSSIANFIAAYEES